MDPITTYIGAGSVAVIIVLVQLFKNFVDDSRFYSLVSVLLGIIINVIIALVIMPRTPEIIVNAFLIGTMAGGSAAGIYDTGKGILNK